MRVLVTGGFGYLGGRLTQFLASLNGFEVILGSRQLHESPDWLPKVKTVQTQWDSDAELRKICDRIDVVLHLAGMNAQECSINPRVAMEFKANATNQLLQAAHKQKVKRFIYISTAHVYGSPLRGAISEETVTAGLHPYATSHLIG